MARERRGQCSRNGSSLDSGIRCIQCAGLLWRRFCSGSTPRLWRVLRFGRGEKWLLGLAGCEWVALNPFDQTLTMSGIVTAAKGITGMRRVAAGRDSVLYICYQSIAEPLTQTQVVAYLEGLVLVGYQVILLTFEPKRFSADEEGAADPTLAEGLFGIGSDTTNIQGFPPPLWTS